ncbi:MAG: YidC/Oxa1 family membrane protein insertase [Spirochaetales bacterium]
MGIMSLLSHLMLADMPPGVWQTLIGYVVDFVGDYGIAIIVFTIILKLLLSPLDFMQRKITKDNTEKQAKVQPALEKLQKKYGNDKNKLNQKTMELYKKENYNIMGSCLGMLLNLVITLFIFITLFTAMRNISEYKLINQYDTLSTAYNDAYQAEYTLSADELLATAAGQSAVIAEYENVKEGFLWVNNIWMPDTNASVIPSYDNFLSLTAQQNSETAPTEEQYNEVMSALQNEYSGWNGLYILIVLSALITYLSQKILTNYTKPKNTKFDEETPTQKSSQIMLFLLPALMVLFTIQYSAAFAVYIVVNSGMTMLTSVVSYSIINKLEKKKIEKEKPEYSR